MGFSLIIFFYTFSAIAFSSASTDTLAPNQTLRDGQTLVSSNQRFELGFFRNSTYLGIWYKDLPLTLVWVANRDLPIPGFSPQLSLGFNGSLSLSSNTAQSLPIWSVTVTVKPNTKSTVLRLLGNGNLVLGNEDGSGDYLWQSFDHIADNLLPEMKLGWDLNKGSIRNVTSWKSPDDPSAGDYTFGLDQPEEPQLVLRRGTQKLFRWGPWVDGRFSGSPQLEPNQFFIPRFSIGRDEIYYSFEVLDPSALVRFEVTHDGLIQYLTWSGGGNGSWVTIAALERDDCKYGACGSYGVCFSRNPVCSCLEGFAPSDPNGWRVLDRTGGCSRKWGLDCGAGDGFVRFGGLKLPDNACLGSDVNVSLRFEECEDWCLRNCSCMAFARVGGNGGGGCLMWFGDLVDLRDFSLDGGNEIFVRMARAEIESIADAKRKKRRKTVVITVISVVFGMLLFGVVTCYAFKRRVKQRAKTREDHTEDVELPLLSLATVSAATDNFSSENKVGQGGFGPVYKGLLPNGQEIAVKRLSENSGQGLSEFKNEVILIAKLQHRNVVKLLGCCIEKEEKMLIYEYLPNRSLDCFLFDQTRKGTLTWKQRSDIITGIARGLLYLHQDSRLRIVHRDLKASNVLMDIKMNPKISDFGIARTLGGEEHSVEKTRRVMGTYGYMSPEYAMNGHFSTKSDIFSFGVLVLEIITGQKNLGFYHPDHDLNLLGHAWILWNEGNPLELIDQSIEKSYDSSEATRCIQVALLCVQQRAEDRPTMSSVVFSLGNESAGLAQPKEPGFVETSFMGMDPTVKNFISSNRITLTAQYGR